MLNTSTFGKSMFQTTDMNSGSMNNSNSMMISTYDGSMLANNNNKMNNDSVDKPYTSANTVSAVCIPFFI